MRMDRGFEGVIPQTMRLYRETKSEWRKEEIEKFMKAEPCKVCMGKRLQPVVLAVKIEGKSIIDATDLSIDQSVEFFGSLPSKLPEKELAIATQVLKGDQREARIPEECGAWISVSFKKRKDPIGRGGAADKACNADRKQPDGRALHPRRAKHRASPKGQ